MTGIGQENTAYYWVNGELTAKKDTNGDKFFYHNDHLGSASVITDENGDLVEGTSYDPWGNIDSGGTVSKFLYTGQEHDPETSLNYYNFRYYNAEVRRFTQPDDMIQNLYDPQSLNRYAYVRNNPIKYTDPTGHCFGTILSAICKAVVGTFVSAALPKPNLTPLPKLSDNVGSHKPSNTFSAPLSDLGKNQSEKPNILTFYNNIREAEKRPINSLNPFVDANNAGWFVNNVRPGGRMDYKADNTLTFESYGNMNFSAVGKAQGWNSYTLHQGAGTVQKWQQAGDKINQILSPGKDIKVRESSGFIFTQPPYWDQQKDYDDIENAYN